MDLHDSLRIAEGEISTLKQWNTYLQERLTNAENLLYRKTGLVFDEKSSPIEMPKPVQQVESWRTARAKFERNWKKSPTSTQ